MGLIQYTKSYLPLFSQNIDLNAFGAPPAQVQMTDDDGPDVGGEEDAAGGAAPPAAAAPARTLSEETDAARRPARESGEEVQNYNLIGNSFF